tara:strand:+ start:522 stop:1391 length:870 start_codon:yes stop_codon:yes gene_type:complete
MKDVMIMDPNKLLIAPNPKDPKLAKPVVGRDQNGKEISTKVTIERPLTLYLNSQEIVTMMTIGDYPEYLAIGYLLNQNMLYPEDKIISIDYDQDLAVVVVRTHNETNFEDKLRKKTLTSGCAQGTIFGDLMEHVEKTRFAYNTSISTSVIFSLLNKINTTPSLYLESGAIHGCVLAETDHPIVYMEDVGRHNAVDKIAGYMRQENIEPKDKIFYTTGRLTSEMIIKTIHMGIPILISRSGFTEWGVSLARKANLTLIGRAKGKRFIALSGENRIIYDTALDLNEKNNKS